ncbi:hypothetical protein NDN08_004798 [Rhodosorus marinus]|uniref:Sugar phosphate transporter domain-containing protein n=1 Tax=Rhodosorus marinus TaxID=101924 RepID=A0AAV8URG2_9RHOD|nr:hypothetical protein NDN08_004798 [Rhodosorus marinus]
MAAFRKLDDGSASPRSSGFRGDEGSVSKAVLSKVKGNLAAADWKVFSFMMLNFFSSAGIVITNKILMEKFHFNFATTLTFIHFICTFVLLLTVSAFGLYQMKELPLGPTSKLAATSMGFVLLTNLSLQHNSIGFYQIMKVMTTPMIVLIEAVLYKKFLERKLRLALVPVCLGVILTASTDFRLNVPGTIFALSSVVVTSFYQIWSGALQKGLDADALQLQTYNAPLSALFIMPLLPVFDNYMVKDPNAIWSYAFNPLNSSLIFLTGFIAFLVNVSIFLVIGKSSALTYNILGHGKTCVIILSDFILFGRPLDVKGISGVLLALGGVFWYTYLKLEKARLEKEAKAEESELPEGLGEVRDGQAGIK